MTSCVAMEKSPNLSEPWFLHQGPACNPSRHSERSQIGKKRCFNFLENWRIKMIRMESGWELEEEAPCPSITIGWRHRASPHARGGGSKGSLACCSIPALCEASWGRWETGPWEPTCARLGKLAPPILHSPANVLLIRRVCNQGAAIIARSLNSRTSQTWAEWWENMGFGNKLNIDQPENLHYSWT